MNKTCMSMALAVTLAAGCSDSAGPTSPVAPTAPTALTSSAPVDGDSWTFSTIDVPGAYATDARGINDQGDIVGAYAIPGDPVGHGYLLSNGQLTNPVDYPGGYGTVPSDINNAGEIVGQWNVVSPGSPVRWGFLRSPAGAYTLIRYPNSQQMRYLAMNDVGEIAGRYRFVDNTAVGFVYSAADGYRSIGGSAGDPCQLPPARCALLPPAFHNSSSTRAPGINDLGHLVVGYTSGSTQFAYRLTHDAFRPISVPGSIRTVLPRINDQGDVTGSYEDAGGLHGFFCRAPCEDAGDYIYPIDFPGAVRTQVWDLNEHGDIVGLYRDASGATHGFVGLVDQNQAPTIAADTDPAVADEGQPASNTGTVGDADGDAVTLSASLGTITDNNDGTWSWSYPTTDGPSESQTVTIDADDGNGGTAQTSFTLSVYNVAPTVNAVAVPSAPVAIGEQPVSASGTFTDPAGTADEPFTCTVDYDDAFGPQPGTVAGTNCTGPAQTYAEAGVYSVTVAVTDRDGGSGSRSAETFMVIYDPSGGFVTGGGWIDSPAGAYRQVPTLTGKATFGFVSKYKKGAQVPTGNTEFQFKAGDLSFHSSSYQWLVINQGGRNAQFKGSGTINGMGDYKFMLWATDDTEDEFRIKIWEEDTGGAETVIYDNGFNQPLGGGSIKVHKR